MSDTRASFQSKLAKFFGVTEESSQKEKLLIGQRLKDLNIPVPQTLLDLQKDKAENEALISQMKKLLVLGFGDEDKAKATEANINETIKKLDEEISKAQAEYERNKGTAKDQVYAILSDHFNNV